MSESDARQGSLVLASASPRRRELLAILTPEFTVEPADIDESGKPDESPDDHAVRLAVGKAAVIAGRHRDRHVLGADTVVVSDGACLGKPRDARHAREMLHLLSGLTHEVYSSVALGVRDGPFDTALSVTRVCFEVLPADWIERYVDSGEPMDKAGAYAIQGAAAAWISGIQGSYSGVVGLPLFETAGLLRRAGLL